MAAGHEGGAYPVTHTDYYYVPMVMQSPPNDLLAICKGDSPTFEEAVDWLAREILKEFPGVEGLVSDMELEDRYKDITYKR